MSIFGTFIRRVNGGRTRAHSRFIGVVEVLGVIGLIAPSVTRIRPGLTPLAACSLVVIMLGAGGGAVAASASA